MKKIDTVILDFGRVLVDFTPFEYLQNLKINEDKIQPVYESVVENDIWNEYDRGVLTEEETLNLFIEKSPEFENEIRLAFSNLNGIVKKYDYTDRWIEELKNKGFRVLYLSNISEKLFNECYKELNYIEKMDGGVLSFKDKMKKPEREIYEHIINKCNLEPEKCVFIDDREENLVEAKKLGINTILFRGYEDAVIQLDKCI